MPRAERKRPRQNRSADTLLCRPGRRDSSSATRRRASPPASHFGGAPPLRPVLPLGRRARKWTVWTLIYTGWGNTIFYLLGNLAPNRGLSGGGTPFGEGTLLGLFAYLPAATASVLTMSAVCIIALGAFRAVRNGGAPPK